ncbi:nucleolar complex protein 2 homolog isoform X2 [Watersipora subatra]
MEHMDVDTFMREGLLDKPGSNTKTASKPKRKGQGQKRREKLQNQPVTNKLLVKTKKREKDKLKSTSKRKSESSLTTEIPGASGVTQHKAVISSLAASDPEFYQFLQKEDKALLNFDDSSDEEDIHEIPETLETREGPSAKAAISDTESESENDSETDTDNEETKTEGTKSSSTHVQRITSAHVTKWSRQLLKNPRIEVVDSLVKALHAAVAEATGDQQQTVTAVRVEGINMFNAVIRACLRSFPSSFAKILGYNPKTGSLPSKCKRWPELKMVVKSYLTALLVLLKNLASPDVINAVLKHITLLTGYIACMPKQTRLYVKAMISIWSTGEETSRVLSFLSLLRLLRLKQEDLLEKTLKAMYMAYVRNCKFTSPTLLPMINFMQHSLIEIFRLDPLLGYQYTFVYIRQLAIHLRNAMASKKKEAYQAVYNWQFIHSCSLYARLVSAMNTDENVSQLKFPLIQIIIGVIRLIPTARFYPLRFQCIRMLNLISLKTGTYIPTLTHTLEVIEITDLQKKMSRMNTRPIDFSCTLKLSKSQTQDRAFKDGLMDQVYELTFDSLIPFSHTLSFPELVIPVIHQMKQFVKTCKIANFNKLFKQLIAKTEETSDYIKKIRRSTVIDLSLPDNVREWERKTKSEGTPLMAYYKQYRLLRDRELQMEIAGKETMEVGDRTPIIPTGQRKATETERLQFGELFEDEDSASDSEEDGGRFEIKTHQNRGQKKKKDLECDSDDVSSLNSEEYAMLDKDVDDDTSGSDLDINAHSEASDQADSNGENDLDNLEGDDIVEDLQLSDMEE